jgi:hypothetical protein
MQIRSDNGLFDESKRMAQSSRAMKWTGFLLAMVLCGCVASAQDTNTLATTATNQVSAPDQIYAALTNTLAIETNAPVNTRELSLQDCIQLALQHNIELQIDRYNPQIAHGSIFRAA